MSDGVWRAYTCDIPGRCPTKGSTKSFRHRSTGRIVTLPMNARLKDWTKGARLALMAAREQARSAMVCKPDGVAVNVLIEFARPTSVTRAQPTVPPDADKCLRAILDAMSGIVYQDDAQVVSVHAYKRYAVCDRVHVLIWRVL